MSDDNKRVVDIDIREEMKKSYLDYSMSVIVSRALPDVRDGLKPVHRRILYAMNDLGMTPDKPHKKSARIVGEVLGKYHPHGDTAVYDAMVRLAQDFSTRYMLIDGHGNFGSVDGDGAAAMRYTEARMSKIALEMLRDIGKDTIDYRLNFDETLNEPKVLPSRFPNLLVNGSSGIAVGMATSIPPHNLSEVIDGIVAMIDNKDITIEEIISHIKGPDFPTGAIIMGKENIREAYRTGRGKVIVRSEAEIEENSKGRSSIIVTEIPYQVNKARLIEKIAELVRDKRIEGISDLRDESDRDGMRIVIEIKRDANANIVLNNLYKYTQLQATFSIIMLALVNDQPKVLNLHQMIKHYLDHQVEVIVRRTQYELNKAEERAHILAGLRIALDNIDAVIKLIRGSSTTAEAKDGLMNQFGLSDKQAQAILDMRLQRLTGLEREKIEEEYNALMIEISRLKEILASEELVYGIIKQELLEIKENYGDERRTKIRVSEEDIDIEDMIQEENVAITLTHFGYIKRLPEDTYKTQKRGGRGVAGLTTREEDFVEHLFITSTHDNLLFFTNQGKVYTMKAYEIPEAKRQARGMAIINLLQLNPEEKITAVIPIRDFVEDNYLILVTKKGITKKLRLNELQNIRKNGLIAISLKEEDELIGVRKTEGDDNVILVTSNGMSITFNEKDVRDMGRTAMGVKAITLNKGDYLVGMDLVKPNKELLVISEFGYGKRTSLDEYRIQSRGGKGIKTYNIKDITGKIISAGVVEEDDDILIVSLGGTIIRLNVSDISQMGRSTQGVRLMKMAKDDKVVSVAKVLVEEENEEE
ncbi:DNA gyrase subunit A [Gottschalkia acidurici 9a]|uniref:DNA gyrase subunit A n=1 Tax=Gottschalkia acidurici (strain ATCC 7906 / DSM 604 / BCRC 14475 / CIP 104303 / KCTC 5404 / NCIMB 10678 / 9a) TaxID=1128398 RepID=K0AWF9_GOTA9|nr:DNA gyrase subunit A [Gottschalkia acidurici]AFS77092.1 DNA gyrase subunit A [Gottschalkia acidurici 9a]